MLRYLFAKVREWWFFESEAERLRDLDDHLLADMGITRSQIGRKVRGELPKSEAPPVRPARPVQVIKTGKRRSSALAYAPRPARFRSSAECKD